MIGPCLQSERSLCPSAMSDFVCQTLVSVGEKLELTEDAPSRPSDMTSRNML